MPGVQHLVPRFCLTHTSLSSSESVLAGVKACVCVHSSIPCPPPTASHVPVGRGCAAFPGSVLAGRGCRSLGCAAPQLTPAPPPHPSMYLSPQKESNSRTAGSKALAPAPPEKNARETSESSDEEELPASQVGQTFSLTTPWAQSWAGCRWGSRAECSRLNCTSQSAELFPLF